MNTVVTSKEEILKKSRELIQENGWASVNIRSVAAACGVSVGSIYNYFESKSALVSATMIKAGIGAAVMPDFAQPVFEGVSTATVPELGRVELGLYWREASAPAREFARCAEEVFRG